MAENISENKRRSSFSESSERRVWRNRFKVVMSINDTQIYKQSFNIDDYIEGSVHTKEFTDTVAEIVEMIDYDIRSKSRVYTWYHTYPGFEKYEEEMAGCKLIDEGQSVFKITFFENGKEFLSQSWDGRYYPAYVRKNVDITNKTVRITKGEEVKIYDAEAFFETHGNQLYGDLYILKQMLKGREDLSVKMMNLIKETCSAEGGLYTSLSEMTTMDSYKNPGKKTVKYDLNIQSYNRKVDAAWGAYVQEKTRDYFDKTPFERGKRPARKN
jgi:DNA-binding transcriptional regulator/RsmH inhibitor MraZ